MVLGLNLNVNKQKKLIDIMFIHASYRRSTHCLFRSHEICNEVEKMSALLRFEILELRMDITT